MIVVPVTLAPLSEAKLDAVERQARALAADVFLFHVLPAGARAGSVLSPAEVAARTHLDLLVARLQGAGVRARAAVHAGSPPRRIVGEAHVQGAALIILGDSGRPRPLRRLRGSVTDAVLGSAPCPVLVVPPPADAPRDGPLRRFADDAAQVGRLVSRPPVLEMVELTRIVGSVGAAHQLGADFRPRDRRRHDAHRFVRVRAAMADGAGPGLPPVELYRLGFGYYVVDGHHRVAAARTLGVTDLEAWVTEFIPAGRRQAQAANAMSCAS